MKNKAFTLVELLAVITLIGLIALVTVVAVTKSLGKSKSAIAKAQEEQLENAARLWMADHQMLKPNISNSDVVCNYAEINSCPKDYKTLVITLDTLQSEGYLDKGVKNLNNGNKLSGATEIEITLNGKKIEYKINKVEIPKFNGTYVKATSTDTHKGIVYMDPTNLKAKCTESNSVSTTGTKTGCMKFYIFDNSGSNYKMILDHNTTGTIKYNATTPYVPYEQASIKTRVESDTAGWVGNPRLITAQEVAAATNTTTFDSSNWDTHFYFDGTGTYKNTPTSHSKGENPYKWLFDYTYNCTSYGCDTDNSTTYGYWTSSPCSSGAWHVANNGGVGVFDVNNTIMGIRPVIELDKDIISGDDTPKTNEYVCKKAKQLNTYETHTYGTNSGSSLVPGMALDCKVSKDGKYDHRFYYVTDLEGNADYAVLIYNHNIKVENNVVLDYDRNRSYGFNYSSSNENWHGPVVAVEQLPTTSQWNNISLSNTSRKIIANDYDHDSHQFINSPSTTGGTTPTAFSYTGKAARLLTFNEIVHACDPNNEMSLRTTFFDNCTYMVENTSYFTTLEYPDGYWLENPAVNYSDFAWRTTTFSDKSGSLFKAPVNSSQTLAGVRPAIEVKKSAIKLK